MTNRKVPVALTCALLSTATLVRGQDAPTLSTPRQAFEVTPYVSVGSDTSSGVGAAVRWPFAPHLSLEVETSYRQAEIGALSSNLSLLLDGPRIGRVTPYVVGGIGLDQYGTPELHAGNVVARGRTGMSVNAGGGVRVQADENWGIRSDARWINGLGGSSPERWRLYNGVTFGRAAK